MAEVATIVASRAPDLAQLDVALAKLPRPTPLRGMVQPVRAGLLAQARQPAPAVLAVEEALRLLPDHPQSKLTAVSIFTFSGAPTRAADLWLQASREAPAAAQRTSSYLIDALLDRLRRIGDHERADRVGAPLSEIGYTVTKASDWSGSALARTRQAVRSGQQAEALQAVTAIGSPGHMMTLYVDRRYEALWPRIAEWADAGPCINREAIV
ncbi:hypothetical protein PK98_02370 [Croceibacterium mercuriale]|uniref:Uncharacterized protein n=1 Tax=Croceibacterium mercuriale TaxID=1572751 RepID=A0A0B2BZT4_9SPHN|nr:hypothetical protein [Croceibacterium mercuriale]KHL25542.1 hypothetical protein PK98_02370 [Croceibacterium mercuriale]